MTDRTTDPPIDQLNFDARAGTAPLPAVLPVSLLLSSARLLIERQLGLAWISGEISGFTRASSGHCYFMLKDDKAQVRCVLFRHKAQLLGVTLQDGASVEVRATPTIYEARGEFQLNVDTVRLAGLGVLYERFARLKARLESAGWFAAERKRPLPAHPRAVGIVTSLRAAALRDVLAMLQRRLPTLPVVLYPSAVQGAGAAGEIARAIAVANMRAEVDVLIVCRGGGSIEDIWAFNEEVVARAVFESRLPVVSGVGHETDFTICDFVADARAPTPTAAAMLVAPDRIELRARTRAVGARWQRASERALEFRLQRLDLVAKRLVHPAARLQQQALLVANLTRRLSRAAQAGQRLHQRDLLRHGVALTRLAQAELRQQAVVERARERWRRAGSDHLASVSRTLARFEQSLRHLAPQAVLDRGYSIVTTAAGAIVQSATTISVGERVRLQFSRGSADAGVTGKADG